MRLLLAGGGTGGHLFPAVALAQRLLEQTPAAQVMFVGTSRGIEARVLPELDLPLRCIDIRGFVNQGLAGKLRLIPCLIKSVWQGLRILREFKPDVVLGVGGYASAPMLVAARLKGIPAVIHEQNAWPGMTNRLLGGWARCVCLSFSEAERAFHRATTTVTGNPLRKGMEDCPPMDDGDPELLIFGGSRGARAINDAMLAALPLLEPWRNRLHIVHQTGNDDLQRVREGYAKAGWPQACVVPFINDMVDAYAKAHLVVCRAGATTLAELAVCGRAAILIPYPHAAGDHQTINAQAIARKGAALVLPQQDLTAEHLASLIIDLMENRPRLISMAAASRSLGISGAADRILKVCRTMCGRN
jgi:UDP-N-acetylglucosamine--N-acetylmuramyl-(pentapeptide) pyrophosphoryl-undecaprenol N-acetylglucosamine transferase